MRIRFVVFPVLRVTVGAGISAKEPDAVTPAGRTAWGSLSTRFNAPSPYDPGVPEMVAPLSFAVVDVTIMSFDVVR
jgi:hypothetical protein